MKVAEIKAIFYITKRIRIAPSNTEPEKQTDWIALRWEDLKKLPLVPALKTLANDISTTEQLLKLC